jgi:hypothetical protein
MQAVCAGSSRIWVAVPAEGGRPGSEDAVRVDVSPEAEEFVRGQGGKLWVWVARPWACCWRTPAYMYAATAPPDDVSDFSPVRTTSLDVWFRAPTGREPDVLEIGMRGRRHPRVEAYWDGSIFAL